MFWGEWGGVSGGWGGWEGGELIVLAWGSAFVSWGGTRREKRKTNPQARALSETKRGEE